MKSFICKHHDCCQFIPRYQFSESLSSFALLDSKILAPPDDPDDIFGMGDNFKENVLGRTTI